MTTRQAIAHELAERARKAGWSVTNPRGISGAYKIKMPTCGLEGCNHLMQIHLSSSDVNMEHTVLREMNKHGLDKHEERAARKAEAERQAALEADRASAEKKARSLANRKVALQKAAGPYMVEPEDVDYDWFEKQHDRPWTRWVYITPGLAEKILTNHNHDNRPLNNARVEHYRNIILSDQWRVTHQGIAQDTRAYLQDGQHRLNAIVEAGKVAPDVKCGFQWSVGMPVENFKAIDEGLLRTAAHLFAKGGEKYGSTLQSMARLVMAYKADDGNVRRQYRIRMTNEQVLDTFEADADLMRDCARRAVASYRKVHTTNSALGAAMYLIRSANRPGNVFVEAFFEGLITGRKAGSRMVLDDDDPRQVLRDIFYGMGQKKRPGVDLVALIILSWNNIVLERSPKNLRFADDAQPPQVLICDDTMSAVPRALAGEIYDDDDEDDDAPQTNEDTQTP